MQSIKVSGRREITLMQMEVPDARIATESAQD